MWHVFHAAIVDDIYESQVAIVEMGRFMQAYTPQNRANNANNRSNNTQEIA